MLSIRSLLLGAALAGASFASSANLITNDNFNDFTGVSQPGSWGIFSTINGWTTTSGAGIEVGKFNNYVSSRAPGQSDDWVVELDSRGNSSMAQSFTVVNAGYHDLSFWYAPRTSTANDNLISIELLPNYADLVSFNATRGSSSGWVQFNQRLWLDAQSYTLTFAAGGLSNSLGGVIDGVNLSHVVPVPATVGLFGLALLAVGASRRRS